MGTRRMDDEIDRAPGLDVLDYEDDDESVVLNIKQVMHDAPSGARTPMTELEEDHYDDHYDESAIRRGHDDGDMYEQEGSEQDDWRDRNSPSVHDDDEGRHRPLGHSASVMSLDDLEPGQRTPLSWAGSRMSRGSGNPVAVTVRERSESPTNTAARSKMSASNIGSERTERQYARHSVFEALPEPYFKPSTNQHQDTYPVWKFRFLFVAYIGLGIWYFYWRAAATVYWENFWFWFWLYYVEVYGFLTSLLFMFNLWTRVKKEVRPLDKLYPPFNPEDWPTVDVLIACYNEPPELVAATCRAAIAMDYPPRKLRITICDDGNSQGLRDALRAMYVDEYSRKATALALEGDFGDGTSTIGTTKMARMGASPSVKSINLFSEDSEDEDNESAPTVMSMDMTESKPAGGITITRKSRHYAKLRMDASLGSLRMDYDSSGVLPYMSIIARYKPPVHHAKAGNLNNALFNERAEEGAEFILFLDADMVPKTATLKNVLPYFFFYSERLGKYEMHRKLAFVQTPQAFTNVPASDPFGHRNKLFFGPIMQGRDGAGATPFVGTNAIVRWDALDSIGGFPTGSVTEDVYMSMRLHANGWQSHYHTEELIWGLSPEDAAGFFAQRARWAIGSLQMLFHENPMTKKGLGWQQKFLYFESCVYPLSSIASLMFMTAPMIYGYGGVAPMMLLFSYDFILHFIPFFIVGRLAVFIGTAGLDPNEQWRSQQLQFILTPVWFLACITIASGGKISFKVTRKDGGAVQNNTKVSKFLTFLYVATLGAIVSAIIRFFLEDATHPWVLMAQIFFCLPNLYHLHTIVKLALGNRSTSPLHLHHLVTCVGVTLVVIWQAVGAEQLKQCNFAKQACRLCSPTPIAFPDDL